MPQTPSSTSSARIDGVAVGCSTCCCCRRCFRYIYCALCCSLIRRARFARLDLGVGLAGEMPRQGHHRRAATSMGQAPAPVDFVAEILCCCDGNVDGGASEHGDAAEADMQGERAFKSKNLETERRRRAKLKHQLFTLRSLVPRITKMSKEATLTDAVDYIQELERQKEELQKELKEMAEEDVQKQGSASSSGAMVEPPAPVHCKEDVEVRPLGKNKFLAGIVCRNKRGGFTRMVEAVVSVGLEVTDASFLTLDGVSQIMLCMEKARGDRVVAGDKVRDLLLWAI